MVIAFAALVFAVYYYAYMHNSETEQFEEESVLPLKTEEELLKMTKQQIDDYAKEQGIELDRRKTKKNMVQDFKEKVAR